MDASRDRGGKEPPVKLSFPQLSRPISTPPRSSYSSLMFPFRSITCSPSYLFVRPLFRFQVSRTKRRTRGESETVILCNIVYNFQSLFHSSTSDYVLRAVNIFSVNCSKVCKISKKSGFTIQGKSLFRVNFMPKAVKLAQITYIRVTKSFF